MFRLQADSAKAVDQFVKRVVNEGYFWVLDDDGKIAGCCSNDDDQRWVYPVFSDRAYAKRGAACWGNVYGGEELSLQFLVETILPSCIEHRILIGPNWDANMAGSELEPQDLLNRLTKAIGLKDD